MHVLQIKQLEKSYKSRKVVNGIDLSIKSSEIVGLLGPNGAGKTTSFYMIVGLIQPDQGRVYLDQQEITYMPMHQRARLGIGYLPQENSIFRKLNVEENIMAVLQLRKDISKQQKKVLLNQLLEEFHIDHLRKISAYSLSGGERRRTEIARALAMEPNFILLDEPFAGIDPISVMDIKQMIKHLSERQIGILITDHNVRETLDICQRAYIVHAGMVIAMGTPNEILANQQVREVYLGEEF